MSNINSKINTYTSEAEEFMANSLKIFFNSFLTEGLFLMVLGVIMLTLPQLTTLTLSIILSISIFFIGIYKFINSIVMLRETVKPWLSIIISIILIGLGIYLTTNPFFNILVLTMTIGIYFILEGVNSVSVAFRNRHEIPSWWITLISAMIQFILAFVIIFGLPFTALWTIGILIGINMIFAGITSITLYFGARNVFS